MKILFEEYTYKTQLIRDILGNFVLSDVELSRPTQQLRYVGYFYSKPAKNEDDTHGDIVFILPKVLLDEDGKAFGLSPEQLINFNWEEWKKDELIVEEGKLSKRQVYDFLYGFAVWIYRAIDIYRRQKDSQIGDHDKSKMTEVYSSVQLGTSGKKEESTFMDVMLSLLDFQRTHKDFITYVIKLAHSGNNKISWARTIARTQAYIQDDTPLYLDPINKKKVINFDEELLVIFYSILNYMHEEYGFPIPNQPGYKLIKGAMFDSYLEGQGKSRLHKIRYKYYSDSAIQLWNLCYAFFDKSPMQKARTDRKDFLLVPSFHCVFEAMIDELVGDTNLPKYLKDQDDNKHIDHIYRYKHLMENMDDVDDVQLKNHIYNIADSKYHKRNSKLDDVDVAKQFTYARNVIQWHMNLLNDILGIKDNTDDYKPIQLYDRLTRGYNIIPNFFISAFADEELNYDNDNFDRSMLGGIERDEDGNIPWVKTYDIKGKGNVHEQSQFYDKLFDRSTLFTLHYDVNFLFVLKTYAQNKSYNKASWKEMVRKKFREGILEFLNQEFVFYQIHLPTEKVKNFIRKHFYELEGKVFSFSTQDDMRVLIYAQRRNDNDEADKWFTHDDDEGDTNIVDGHLLDVPDGDEHCLYKMENVTLGETQYKDIDTLYTEYALVGYYKDQEHLDWILENGIYNMPTVQRGKKVSLNKKLNATYLILHNPTLGNHLLKIDSDTISYIKREHLPEGEYKPGHKDYYIYHVSEERTENTLLKTLIDSERFQSRLQNKKPTTINLKKLYSLAEEVPPQQLTCTLNKESVISLMVAEDEEEYS